MNHTIGYIFQLIDRFTPQAGKLGGAAKGVDAAMKKAGSSTVGLNGALGKLGRMTTLAAKQAAALGKSLTGAAGGANTLSGGATKAASSVGMISSAAARAQAALAALQASMVRVGRTALYNRGLVSMGGYEAAARARGLSAHGILSGRARDQAMRGALGEATTSGSRFGRLGRTMAALGRPVMAPLGVTGLSGSQAALGASGLAAYSLLKRYADFQAAEIAVTTIGRKLGNSDAELKALSKTARKLGAETIFEPQDVLQGALQFMKAGRSAKESRLSVPSALNLAAAADMTVTNASKAALNFMSLADLNPDQLKQAIDALTATFLSSKVEMSELANAAPYLLGKLSGINVPLNQQLATLGALAEGGMAGSRGAMAMSMVIQTLQKAPTMKKQAGLLALYKKRYGIDLMRHFDKNGNLTDLRPLFADFQRLQELTGKRFSAEFFPGRAGRGVEVITKDRPMLAFNRTLENAENLGGVAEEIAKAKFEGLTGALRQLGAAWSDLGIASGNSGTGKAVEAGFRQITDVINSFRDSFDAGSFLEELFDPAALMLRAGGLATRLSKAIIYVLATAIRSSVNAIGEAIGVGPVGDRILKALGFDEMMAGIDKVIAMNDSAIEDRLKHVRRRVQDRNAMRTGPTPGSFRAGQEVGMADSVPASVAVRASIDPVHFNPAQVNVTVTGKVDGTLQGTGSATLQAQPSRGTASGNVGSFSPPMPLGAQ